MKSAIALAGLLVLPLFAGAQTQTQLLNSSKTTFTHMADSLIISTPRTVVDGKGYGFSGATATAEATAKGICAQYQLQLATYSSEVYWDFNDSTIDLNAQGQMIRIDSNQYQIKTVVCKK